MKTTSSSVFADSKPHYDLLDGLRGVAALLVLWYHVFEGYQFAGNQPIIEFMNHGYLAVDFFFILSGFVIGYAYDDRMRRTLTLGGFFKRRLIRLHPMVMLCAVIGMITFYVQGGVKWDGTQVATSAVMLSLLMTMFLLPVLPGTYGEVRGNGEMYPLNGPSWSLFFEYIGNIIYALLLSRLSKRALTVLVSVLAACVAYITLADVSGYGFYGVGWTLDGVNFLGGFFRMIFPFSMGILLSRYFKPAKIRGAFWICTLILLVLFFVPYIPGLKPFCWNGLYEFCCIAFVFPVVVWIGASGATTDRFSSRVCKFLGDISFPLYIIHYPFMYLFYAWLIKEQLYTFAETWQVATMVCVWNVIAAYACLKLYDEPVRKWLARKFINGKSTQA